MDNGEYKPFHETYKIITFAMSIGLIYPNPAKWRSRLYLILLEILSVLPISLFIVFDIYKCWLSKDITNIFRHSTVVGPFIAGFLKMFIVLLKEQEVKMLIDEFNYDYARCNSLPPHHKTIVDNNIRNNKLYTEKRWAIFVSCTVGTFPLMAVGLNVYSFIFTSENTKYMVHDVPIPFLEPGAQYRSPYYEFLFVYMVYAATLYIINFTGYDGFFGLCINHACLKMELYCKSMEEAMKAETKQEMYEQIAEVINDQCRLFRYVGLIQEIFHMWLGLALIATIIQIGTSLYHITEGYEFDLRYMIFVIGTVIYISQPCHFSSKLKTMCAETAVLLYCCGWERVQQQRASRTLLLMIARAQQPSDIVAFNMIIFDMELFVSILQTSYSMYTLLSS